MKTWLFLLFCTVALFAEPDRDKEKRSRRQASFSIRVIEASSAQKATNDAVEFVPAELKSMLRYKSYGLLDSAYLRGKDEDWLEIAIAGNMSGRVRWFVTDNSGQMLNVAVRIKGPASPGAQAATLLDTETSAKNGETVVLGASRMQGGDKALIILLTAKLL